MSNQSDIFPTSKRSACDRCRSQKLRYPPREQATDRCSRCTRLGVQCTTSFHRPLGRVSKSSSAPSRRIQPSPSPFSTLPSQSLGAHGQSSPGPTSSSGGDCDSALFSFTSLETQLSTNFPFASSQTSQPLDHSPFSSKHFDALASFPISDYSNIAEDGPAHIETDIEEADEVNGSHLPTQPSSNLDCDKRLSHLNHKLSTRLEQCFLRINHNSHATPLSPSQESSGSAESASPWDSHALGDILRDTVEFIAIIESYTPGRDSSSTTRTNVPLLGTVVQLNLLSVHLQLIATYDRLLQHFYSQLCTDPLTPPSPTSSARTPPAHRSGMLDLPGMDVAGFRVQQGTLQTKILLETILHHLGIVERVMELPIAWRVTDRQRDSRGMGLFENRQARLVLEAVGLSTLSLTEGALDDQGKLPAIASLRDGIQRLQVVIE
ncbi:hypothetical protein F5Y05DRAFT_164398 [Hypoxylon sp. FL0543]|nr:hypothetical protein F5Y05DRAFT_164398 [Hypoxylon sp. FL0543]